MAISGEFPQRSALPPELFNIFINYINYTKTDNIVNHDNK